MRVIICGAGKVGTSIARQLATEDNHVTVVDQSPELIRDIADHHDVNAFVGFASHPHVLERAGAMDADMLIAVTQMDEVNMVACQIGHSIFHIPTKIARIRNEHYLHPLWHDLYRKDHLPIDIIISPEVEVAQAIHQRLHLPGSSDMAPFSYGLARLIAVRCQDGGVLIGKTIHEVMKDANPELMFFIIGAVRNGKFLLRQDINELEADDDLYFITSAADARQCMEYLGHKEKEAHRVLILGGGNIGLYLAQLLEEEEDVHCKIIEKDAERANFIADKLKRTMVLCGSAMDKEILEEAGIEKVETLVAVTNDDKVNILSGLLAKQQQCPRVISLVNNQGYNALVKDLGIDVVMSPRGTTISSILKHIRRGKILDVYSIAGGSAEILEAKVMDTSEVAGKTLEDIALPRGIIVAAIIRDGIMHMPTKDSIITAGDHVIIMAMANMVKKVERYFSVKFEFF